MDFVRSMLTKFDYTSQTAKLGITFVVMFVAFFVLSPGTFFEIEPLNSKEKVKFTQQQKYATSGAHAFIFAILAVLFVYFYLFSSGSSNSKYKLGSILEKSD
jgi:ABC-type Fe3+-siderophore transport system permease subunit